MKLASVFTDHAVFQRRISVPVWGSGAKPGSMLCAELAGKTSFTRVAADGSFFFRFPPFEAGGPYELAIRCKEDGTSLLLKDILIGEVWLAGGQSNMEYQLNSDWSAQQSLPESEKKDAVNRTQLREYLDTLCEDGMIREFHVPKISTGSREPDIDSAWRIVDKKTAPEVSAVAAWFARFIQERIKVPVGLLTSNWGGTIAEAWTSRAGLLSNPATAHLPLEADSFMQDEDKWIRNTTNDMELLFEKYSHKDPGNQGFGWGWADPAFDDSSWRIWNVPGDWVGQKVAGHGAVWTRVRLFIPESWAGQDLTLRLGRIDKTDTTYFNGVEIGHTGTGGWDQTSWNIPRTYTIPAKLVKPGKCVIAVRIFSFVFGASIHGDLSEFSLSKAGDETEIPLAGQWKIKPEVDFGVIQLPSSSTWCSANPNSASILFDAMLRPLFPYALRGAIWYQGESNAPNIAQALAYREALKTMIRDWRYHWEEGDFPFIQVELANFREPSSYDPRSAWPLLREAQSACCRELPNVYMASAIDIGEAEDIHPQNKKDVGRRLAMAALHHVYQDSSVALPEGPRFTFAEREGNRIRLHFQYGAGLHFKGTPKGFYVSNGSANFIPADHVVTDGDSVLVSSDTIPQPFHVRYSWSDNPDGNLYNAAELPAASFRTDSMHL